MNWCEFNLKFQTKSESFSNQFLGSMMRGSFGHALKKLVCVMRSRPCEGCPLEFTCIYTQIFEPRPAPAGKIMSRYSRAPNPFLLVVDFPAGCEKIDHLSFGLRLFGSAHEASPFILRAFEEAGEHGLSKSKIPFKLTEVTTETDSSWKPGRSFPSPAPCSSISNANDVITWKFKTPTRIMAAGNLLTPHNINAAALAMSMLRRYGLMHAFYSKETKNTDFQAFKQSANRLKIVKANVWWKSLKRYSNRQNTTQSISGIMGEVSIDTSNAPEWREILPWAPILHLGKNTTMGLGRVTMS